MKWYICITVAIFGLLNHEVASNPALLDLKVVLDVATFLSKIIQGAETAQDMASQINGETSSVNAVKEILMNRIDDLQETLTTDIPEDIQEAAGIDNDLRQMFTAMTNIDHLYNSYYLHYLDNTISNSSLHKFIVQAMSLHEDSPDREAALVYRIIVPGDLGAIKSSFFGRLVAQLNTRPHHRCRKLKSPQQYVLQIYNLIGIMQLRTTTMVTTAYKLDALEKNEDYDLDIKRINDKHEKKMRNYLKTLKESLTYATDLVAHCQPTYDSSFELKMINQLKRRPKYISMVNQMSDWANNMVITGVEFVVDEELDMVFIHVKEGKLMPGGKIQDGSVKWVPLGVDKIWDDEYVLDKPNAPDYELVAGEDHSQLIYTYSYLHLEDVKICASCLVIGAKIACYNTGVTFIYYLRLTYVEANINAGTIKQLRVNFAENYVPDDKDSKNGRDDPKLFKIGPGTSIKYFDNNEIVTSPEAPINGIGIYKAHDSEHGDALALRMHSLNLAQLVKPEML